MKTKYILLGAALLGSLLNVTAFAANELMELRPLKKSDRPVLTKVVAPTSVPATYVGSTVMVSLTVNAAGEPRNIRILDPDDLALTNKLLPVLSQWRFDPVSKDGVRVESKVLLPIKLTCDSISDELPLQIGALKVAFAHGKQLVATRDKDGHPAMYHVNAIDRDGQIVLRDTAPESAVRECLGEPERLSDNVWAYPGFCGMSENADRHGCDTVLISFHDHRVDAIALVNDRAMRLTAAQLKTDQTYVENTLRVMHVATAIARN